MVEVMARPKGYLRGPGREFDTNLKIQIVFTHNKQYVANSFSQSGLNFNELTMNKLHSSYGPHTAP